MSLDATIGTATVSAFTSLEAETVMFGHYLSQLWWAVQCYCPACCSLRILKKHDKLGLSIVVK